MAAMSVALPTLLQERARSHPDKVFLEEVTGGRETFAQTLRQTYRWMAILQENGVKEGDKVAVMMPVSIQAHHLWFACAFLKAWEVPVNNAFKGAMLKHILEDSGATLVVLADRFVEAFGAIVHDLAKIRAVIVPDLSEDKPDWPIPVLGPADLPADGDAPADLPEYSDEDVATVLYTSGTTGPSKGCVLPWGEFYWGLDLFGPRKDGTDCHYCPFPTNHMSGKVPVYNMAAYAGRVVLRERFSLENFWPDVRRFGCTTTMMLGSIAYFIYGQPEQPDDADNPLATVFIAPIIPEYRAFEKRFGLRIIACYGMTEIAFPFLLNDRPVPNHETCGRLRDQWEVRIVDDTGEDVGTGEVGELLVRCRRPHSMMKEYLGRPEATAEAWRGGWFHTGDALRFDKDGNYYFVDRIKDAIRRRGENISSFEVEAQVREHPAVQDCAAIAVPDDGGEDEVKVVVVPEPGQKIDPEELIRFLVPRMPDFMIPRYVEIAESLPLTPTNKVRKVELRRAGINERTWDRVAARVAIK